MVGYLLNKVLKINWIIILNSLKGFENILKFGIYFFLYWYILCLKCMFNENEWNLKIFRGN